MLVSDPLNEGNVTPIVGKVLILVLVDVGLGRVAIKEDGVELKCLNPCFSGCWSRTNRRRAEKADLEEGLNPCFSGCWSRTYCLEGSKPKVFSEVLILVLVDVGLGQP